MSAYFIKNSSNNIDLINISQSDDAIMIRLFGRYNGPTDNLTAIPRQGLETNMTEYPGGSLLTDTDGTNYTQRWVRSLKLEENQVQVGGTYLFCTNDDKNFSFRLDANKYPDLEISDWKWIRCHSLRPIVKFTMTHPGQNFSSMNKCYYLSSGVGSTKVITSDVFVDGIFEDKDVSLIPAFTMISGTAAVTLNTDTDVSATMRIVNKVNMLCDDVFEVSQGVGGFSFKKQDSTKPASCDILFGFTKILHLEDL